MAAQAPVRVTLEVTTHLQTALAQLSDSAHDPLSLNPHAYFVLLDADDRVQKLINVWYGTNCDTYWACGAVWRRDERTPRGGEDDYEIPGEPTLEKLSKFVRRLLRAGYLCVTVKTRTGAYQYPREHLSPKSIDKLVHGRSPAASWEDLLTSGRFDVSVQKLAPRRRAISQAKRVVPIETIVVKYARTACDRVDPPS